MTTAQRSRPAILTFLGFILCAAFAPSHALAQPYLIDTGAGGTTSIGSLGLFASGSTTCSPQPACASNFQFLAARITLPQAATISAIELWVVPFSFGGQMDVKIREEVNGLPSTFAPPLFSPNSIYSRRYMLPNIFSGPGWVPFSGYEAVLAAGTYWVTFEPVHGSNLNYSVPGGAPTPVSKYAFFGNGNPGYLNLNQALGVRVAGTYFSGVAFGTATRVSANYTYFNCCSYSDDFIQEGTRDFTPLGTQGAALTSSYIFAFGVAHVHGNGRLNANGLSAGAYSSTGSSGVGAGRGIAYRTLMNMSDQPRTFRVNANLDGAFFHSGGSARAGVYVFDTALFSSTLLASPKTPGHFLLDADNMAAIANEFQSISLARFFPPAALLASDLETASFPVGVPTALPLQTGFVTLAPGGSITVLFDVAVYAPSSGQVDFGNTLASAPAFLTDMGGSPVFDVLVVGPSAPATGAVATLGATPAAATTTVGTAHAVTFTAQTAGGVPVPGTAVTVTITSGPNAGAPVTLTTDGNGEAIFAYLGATPGTDSIQGSIGALQASAVTSTWASGPVDRIVLTPLAATIAVGTSQEFAVEAFDALSNDLGNVAADSAFSITPDGSCTGASCTATTPGAHTVTANYQGKNDQATLTFTGSTGYSFTGFFAPIDNLPVVNTMKAGASVPVKFSLDGNQGLDIFAPGYPASQVVACVSGIAEDQVEQIATAGSSGLTYEAATDRYVYVWKTDKSWSNKCRQLVVKLKDGSVRTASFKFK